MRGLEEIVVDGELSAILLRSEFDRDGIHFFTPDDYSQQVGHMQHPAGKQIVPHRHVPHPRQIHLTNEVLIVKSGKLRVDLYASDDSVAVSRVLNPGDLILLVSGGHGFEVLEDVKMIEVKQGPYVGEADKARLSPEKGPDL